MSNADFEQRRREIFQAIVEAYVASAEPVGSALISRRLRPALSPATIRHVMVELEEAGYVEQPHTSAGRVPTDRGYRYYVDAIMETPRPSAQQLREMEALIDGEDVEVGVMLERASDVLSQVSQQAAFVIAPTVKQSRVKQIEFVPLGVRKLLCVLIANEEMIASHVVELEEPMNREEAIALARFLNTELVGLPFNELLSSLQRRLLAQTDSFYHLVKRSMMILEHALSTEPAQRLIVEGASYVVSQSEFRRDPRKAHELLRRLEEEEELLACLGQDVGDERVRVRIGRELKLHGLENCSCVTGAFAVGHEIVGGIGVLGPKRMDYRRLHALVDGMAHSITNVLTRWTGA